MHTHPMARQEGDYGDNGDYGVHSLTPFITKHMAKPSVPESSSVVRRPLGDRLAGSRRMVPVCGHREMASNINGPAAL